MPSSYAFISRSCANNLNVNVSTGGTGVWAKFMREICDFLRCGIVNACHFCMDLYRKTDTQRNSSGHFFRDNTQAARGRDSTVSNLYAVLLGDQPKCTIEAS